jgi:hypothetical protein
MHFGRKVVGAFLTILATARFALAGPGGYLTFTNGSPYEWKLLKQHSYQMDWNPPFSIRAGANIEQYLEFWYHWGDNGDCAAEATYTLVGSPAPASFVVQARQSNGKRLQIQLQEGLSCLGNSENSLIDLGFIHNGGVAWILAGNPEDEYVCSNPPVGWMQATYGNIGDKSLRQISMPASHDAGMSEITWGYGGVSHNTVTQSVPVYQQLVYGARYFDIRPVYHYSGKWYTGHFSAVFGVQQWQGGALGQTIDNIVADIQRFSNEHPGELIILDLSHEMNAWRFSWAFTFEQSQWHELYKKLSRIGDLWSTRNLELPDDLTTVPLSEFIQQGTSKSVVLIRVPDYAPLAQTPDTPIDNTTIQSIDPLSLSFQAFVPSRRLPSEGSYSNTDDTCTLISDQLSKQERFRTTADSRTLRSVWTITQRIGHVLDVGNWYTSIIADAIPAHRFLFSKLWNSLSSCKYPNLIEVDDINNSQITALCMAINTYLVSGNGHVQAQDT